MAERPVAVVTGSSGAIGSEISRLLASRGIDVILVDRNAVKSRAFAIDLRKAYPNVEVESFALDLTDHADIDRVAAAIVSRYPTIAYLFNNAGVLTESLQFSKYGNELHFEVNTLAPLRLVDLLSPALARAPDATIVNTSAGLASGVKALELRDLIRPSAPFVKLFGPYVKSKAAINVLTAALASELADVGVSIRSADPGPTKSPLTKGAGTPLWMRLFYFALPGARASARTIVDVALATTWRARTGVFVSGKKERPLPAALADANFQKSFLAGCRERYRSNEIAPERPQS